LLSVRTRSYDVRCRVGENEFAVLLSDQEPSRVRGSQHPCSGVEFLWRLRGDVQEAGGKGLGPSGGGLVRLHAGLASFPWDTSEPAALLEKARQSLREGQQVNARCLALTGPRAGRLLHAGTLPSSLSDSSESVPLEDEPGTPAD
jgi:hypothetical protein